MRLDFPVNNVLLYILLCLCIAGGCDEGESAGPSDADVGDADGDSDSHSDADVSDADSPDTDPDADIDDELNPDCDPLVPSVCALPWPSSLFLVEDTGSATGLRLAFGPETMPANISGVRPPPELFARFDGYSVGTALIVQFPEIDVSTLPGELTIAASLEDDSSLVLLEIGDSSIRRVPCFAELDARATPGDEAPVLFIRPAEILQHGMQYIVVLRNLQTLDGSAMEPSPAFRALRDGEALSEPQLADRVDRFEELFSLLDAEGIDRDSLTLAWDFTTASAESSQGDMISIRDQAYEAVGETGPELTIDTIESFLREDDGSGTPVDPEIAHQITGTFRVPLFTEEVTRAGDVGHVLHRDVEGVPAQNGWVERVFTAMIPHDNGLGQPLELVEFGHGLLASHERVFRGSNRRVAYDYGQLFFGATLTGFGTGETTTITGLIYDPNRILWFTERIHQGIIEYVLLARAMQHRFASLPEITELGVTIDTSRVAYSGISQGGIYGATVVALSREITRGHLGVPGSNYSLLLERSVDFAGYLGLIEMFYPRRAEQPLVVEAVVTTWQTTDPGTYYRNISAQPLPDTPPNLVLLAQAQGDWQVTPLSNEIAVRSGAEVALMENYGRTVDLVEPTAYPHVGSALVNYSFGDAWPPPGNYPPPEGDRDPHQLPRDEAHHSEQMVHFFRTGEVIDVCGGDGCTPD